MPAEQPPADSPSSDSGSERRREPRAPIELKVEYKRLNSFFADYTRNISKGGTFIVTTKPLPIGTEFLFQLTIPKMSAPLQIHGKVAWIVEADAASTAQPAGMGIRFKYADDGERQQVHGAVEQLMEESLGRYLARKLLDDEAASESGADGSSQDDGKPGGNGSRGG